MTKHFFTIVILISIAMPVLHAGEVIRTPLEKSDYTSLSGHSDMMEYLREIDKKSAVVSMEIMGYSVEGRELPALYFSLDKKFGSHRSEKPMVLIFCQQHGDEPSGKEATLVLARELTGNQKNMLENLDLILIPQMNPDGGEKNDRRNANQMDLNRNHMILSEPETQALHDVFLKWMPEVTLDVHEYGSVSKTWMSHGFMKDADEQFGKLSNMNISEHILHFSRDVMVPEVGTRIKAAGFTFHEYVVGTPFRDSRMRYSTTAINDGRQSLGIFNTLSFILEGKQYGDVLTDIERRTQGQLAGITAFLQTVSEQRSEILNTVSSAREKLLSGEPAVNKLAYIQMDYYPDSSHAEIVFPVFNLENWKHEEKTLKNFHSKVKVRKSVEKPQYYVIPADEEMLLEILSRHQIRMKPVSQDTSMEVEAYTILHVTSFVEEELEIPYVDLKSEIVTKSFEKGSVLIALNQPAGLMIPLVLEPQSTYSLCKEGSGRKYRLDEYLRENSEYPVYRVLK